MTFSHEAAMLNDHILASLTRFATLAETDEGARLETHCLYPSFDPVHAFIAKVGGAYKVHDGAGAFRAGWDSGRDSGLIRRAISQQAATHELMVIDDALVGDAADEAWLIPAILSVVNASAAAAHNVVTHSATANEVALRDRIYTALVGFLAPTNIARDWQISGRSGKSYEFDFGVRLFGDRWLLIDSVSPHHVSIAAKYVAFSDTRDGPDQIAARFAVYDRPLEADDVSLLQQVADLVPFASLPAGVRREMATA
jgi:hypothetical protein